MTVSCVLAAAVILIAPVAGSDALDAEVLKSRLEVANTTGNQDYLILYWKVTEGKSDGVTFTVQVFDEGGRKRWRNVAGLSNTERQAALFVGEAGHRYRFSSIARRKPEAREHKADDEADAVVEAGSARKDISFGVNPYPLCPANSGGAYRAYDVFSLVRDEYMQMAYGYHYRGPGKLKRGDLVIETPPGVVIPGATYMPYFNREFGEIPVYVCGTVRRDGKKYTVHFVPNTPKTEAPYYGYRHILRVYFGPEPRYAGGDKLYWHAIQDGVAGQTASVPLEVLPELKITGVPKHFDNHVRMQPEMYRPDDPFMTQGEDRPFILKRYELMKKIGLVAFVGGKQVSTRRTWWLVDNGFKVAVKGGIGHGWLMPGYYGKMTKEKIAEAYGTCEDEMFWRNADGKDPYGVYEEKGKRHSIWCYYCPTYLARTDTAFYKGWTRMIRDWWSYNKVVCDGLKLSVADSMDFEIAMRNAIYDHCFCPRCVEAFAKRTRLSPEGLTSRKILSDHQDQWREFRVWQNGRIVRTWHQANKSISRGKTQTTVMVCTQPMPPVGHDNLDIRHLDAFIDAYKDEVTYVGPRLYDHIDSFYKYVSKPCTVYPNPCSQLRVVTPSDARLGMLATASSGGGGFMTDQWFELTGRHFHSMIKARNEIAALEDYFREGKRADDSFEVAVLPLRGYRVDFGGEEAINPTQDTSIYLRRKAHALDGAYLLDLFNYSGKAPLFLRVSFPEVPECRYVLYDPVERTQYVPDKKRRDWGAPDIRNGFMFKVPREDVKFLLLKKAGQEIKYAGKLALSTYQQEYAAVSGPFSEAKPTLKDGEITIGWDRAEQKGRCEIVVETPCQTVWICPSHGSQIWKWHVKEDGRDVVHLSTHQEKGKYGRTLGMDRFQHWGWGQESVEPYRLVSRTIKGDRAIVALERDFTGLKDPANGTILRKTYTVFAERPVLRVNVEVENRKEVPYSCDFYAPQWPYLGKKELDKLPIGQRKWRSMEPDKDADQSVGAVYCPATGEAIAAKVDPERLRTWYIGRAGHAPPVFEWMYNAEELAPGERWRTQYDLVYLRKCTPEKVNQQVRECLKGISR